MYAAKVKVGLGPSPAADPPTEVQAGGQEEVVVGFSAGNPRVEHITGVVHLFRTVPNASQASAPVPALPDGHGLRLCVLSMPADFGVADFCSFLGAYLPSVREMRVVRSEVAKNVCLVFLTFNSVKQAALFYKDYNGRAFSSLEPDVRCRLVFIKDLEILSGDDSHAVRPPPGQTELPSCPVCLERLDQHISGVVTTVCNHRFHSQCLRQWGDESCPVCRYKAGHSIDHWRESSHVYALELETQRVWDYVGDGYVHRLIQSKTDGKLVEVPSPAPAATSSRTTTSTMAGPPEADPDSDLHDALFASKVDAFAAEYNHLLVSQLDSQRQYYEGLLRGATGQRAQAEAQAAADAGRVALRRAEAEGKLHLQAQKVAERRLVEANVKLSDMRKERDYLKTLSEGVMRNSEVFRERMKAAEQERDAHKAQIADLEDQVRDLMIFLDARQKVAEAGADVQGGSASAPEPPKPRRSRKK